MGRRYARVRDAPGDWSRRAIPKRWLLPGAAPHPDVPVRAVPIVVVADGLRVNGGNGSDGPEGRDQTAAV